jgi:hypothetical protein
MPILIGIEHEPLLGQIVPGFQGARKAALENEAYQNQIQEALRRAQEERESRQALGQGTSAMIGLLPGAQTGAEAGAQAQGAAQAGLAPGEQGPPAPQAQGPVSDQDRPFVGGQTSVMPHPDDVAAIDTIRRAAQHIEPQFQARFFEDARATLQERAFARGREQFLEAIRQNAMNGMYNMPTIDGKSASIDPADEEKLKSIVAMAHMPGVNPVALLNAEGALRESIAERQSVFNIRKRKIDAGEAEAERQAATPEGPNPALEDLLARYRGGVVDDKQYDAELPLAKRRHVLVHVAGHGEMELPPDQIAGVNKLATDRMAAQAEADRLRAGLETERTREAGKRADRLSLPLKSPMTQLPNLPPDRLAIAIDQRAEALLGKEKWASASKEDRDAARAEVRGVVAPETVQPSQPAVTKAMSENDVVNGLIDARNKGIPFDKLPPELKARANDPGVRAKLKAFIEAKKPKTESKLEPTPVAGP